MGGITLGTLDHIVLNVRDVERSVNFYTGILGLSAERLAEFKAGAVGFPSVRINGSTVIDLLPIATEHTTDAIKNLAHFCLVAEDQSIEEVVRYLVAQGIAVHEGPARRWGARGFAQSVYFFDPDNNEIEIRCYGAGEDSSRS